MSAGAAGMSLLSSPWGYTFPSPWMLPAQRPVPPLDLTKHLRLLGIPQCGFTAALCTKSGAISPASIQYHCNIPQSARWYLVLGTGHCQDIHIPCPYTAAPGSPEHLSSWVSPLTCTQPGQGCCNPLPRVPSEAAVPCLRFPKPVPFLSFPAATGRDGKISPPVHPAGFGRDVCLLLFIYPSFITTKYKR